MANSTEKKDGKAKKLGYELECWRSGAVDVIVDVQHSGMSEDMEKTACQSAASALRMFNTQMDIAEHLKKSFDIEFGPCWHCICGKQFGSFISTTPGNFIYFRIGSYAFVLYRTQPKLFDDIFTVKLATA